jgi:hypothetical protein
VARSDPIWASVALVSVRQAIVAAVAELVVGVLPSVVYLSFMCADSAPEVLMIVGSMTNS